MITLFIVINQIPADKLPEKLDYLAMLCENIDQIIIANTTGNQVKLDKSQRSCRTITS